MWALSHVRSTSRLITMKSYHPTLKDLRQWQWCHCATFIMQKYITDCMINMTKINKFWECIAKCLKVLGIFKFSEIPYDTFCLKCMPHRVFYILLETSIFLLHGWIHVLCKKVLFSIFLCIEHGKLLRAPLYYASDK